MKPARPAPDISDILRDLMAERGLTASALAARLEVAPQYVSQILNRKRSPSAPTIARIAGALHVPVAMFPAGRAGDYGRRAATVSQKMNAIDLAALRLVMDGLREARRYLLDQPVDRIVTPAAGKADTLALDAETEAILWDHLRRFSEDVLVLTEERGAQAWEGAFEARWAGASDSIRPVFIMDPFDRSKATHDVIVSIAASHKHPPRMADILPQMKQKLRDPIRAPFAAVTFVRAGAVQFAAFIQYLSGDLIVACPAFVKIGTVERCATPEELEVHGHDVVFEPRASQKAVYYPGAGEHKEARRRLAEQMKIEPHRLVSEKPGGPARIFSIATASPGHEDSVGGPADLAIVASVGEKIGEWIHWLAVAQFSRALCVYELAPDAPFAQDKLLLAPSPPYSVLRPERGDRCFIDTALLLRFGPRYRGCLAVTHIASLGAKARLQSLRFSREILSPRG